LFAGIAWSAIDSNPIDAASASTASKSRIPLLGDCRFSDSSNARLLSLVNAPL